MLSARLLPAEPLDQPSGLHNDVKTDLGVPVRPSEHSRAAEDGTQQLDRGDIRSPGAQLARRTVLFVESRIFSALDAASREPSRPASQRKARAVRTRGCPARWYVGC